MVTASARAPRIRILDVERCDSLLAIEPAVCLRPGTKSGAANSEWPPEFCEEELMRTERRTIRDQAIAQVDHQVDLAGWSRSITCTEMMRAGFIILNQALILASSIFSG